MPGKCGCGGFCGFLFVFFPVLEFFIVCGFFMCFGGFFLRGGGSQEMKTMLFIMFRMN